MTHKVFDNDPRPVNIMLLSVAVCVGLALVIFVGKKSASTAKADLRAEADAAEERLMPGAENGFNSNGDIRTYDYGTIDSGSPKSNPAS